MKDEIDADYYASTLLKKRYGIERTSIVVEKALSKVAQRSKKDGISETFF